jgi:hypothetical protein
MATFQFSENEYVRACHAMARRHLWRSAILMFIAVSLIAGSYAVKGKNIESWAVGIICGLLFFFILARVIMARRIKRAFREQESLRQEITVVFDDEQLAYSWSRGSFVLPWADVRRWKETKDFFLLYESSLFAKILPKRSLSEDEVAIIRRKAESLKKV